MEGEESERGQTDQTRKGKARQGKTRQDKIARERERERERESNPCPLLLFFQVLREGGVVGVVEGLAPKGRRLSPPEYLEGGKEGEGRGESEKE